MGTVIRLFKYLITGSLEITVSTEHGAGRKDASRTLTVIVQHAHKNLTF